MISTFHLVIIAFVAFLLFGKRLPELMKAMGQGISEFKKGLDDANK